MPAPKNRLSPSNILLISSPEHIDNYKRLFGTGEQFGINISYALQPRPRRRSSGHGPWPAARACRHRRTGCRRAPARPSRHISYALQPKPDGLAQAFIIGREFVGDDSVALVLGGPVTAQGDSGFFGFSTSLVARPSLSRVTTP
jgi:glucose-1-phosphate thymidylyltransferase